ncbi:PREDICTED: E3 ubiquitin-protein ligase TRIM11-like [Elephantulus edwardii]|uniref:E3 ubiquitin-protein ligase TRIM11-like n=1 Tax=Elephantulus edwardii TaxID=28737 RepID=UPI0003F0593F|nr:PREDICTED: E3 ubiquitin-protein ligase TRIM11-like [Elephantulus edwardii]
MELKTVCKVPGLLDTLRKFQVVVTLDPDSAHPFLTLSEDRRAVSQRRPWHGQLGLFGSFPSVVGCERLTAGRYYWEVELRDGGSWHLGVCKEDVDRMDSSPWTADRGFWSKGDLIPAGAFNPQKNPHPRVGVFLDYEGGEISFYSVNEESHIYTFPQAYFSGPLRPIFITPSWCQTSLIVCPKQETGAKDAASGGEKPLESSPRGSSKPSLFVFGDAPA